MYLFSYLGSIYAVAATLSVACACARLCSHLLPGVQPLAQNNAWGVPGARALRQKVHAVCAVAAAAEAALWAEPVAEAVQRLWNGRGR